HPFRVLLTNGALAEPMRASSRWAMASGHHPSTGQPDGRIRVIGAGPPPSAARSDAAAGLYRSP
ncbi:MAG: hypothetical protein WBN24_09460, partial [Acidimicrobiia bacterium]